MFAEISFGNSDISQAQPSFLRQENLMSGDIEVTALSVVNLQVGEIKGRLQACRGSQLVAASRDCRLT